MVMDVVKKAETQARSQKSDLVARKSTLVSKKS
jgi:hypothetical protein